MRTFSLPDPTAHAGEFLQTDGVNYLWAAAGGGGGTIGGTVAATEIGYGSGVNTLTSNNTFTYDASTANGILNVGGALLYLKDNGLNPADLWVGQGSGSTSATSADGRNTGMGYFVGTSLTTGGDNSFFGQASGYANDAGNCNAFFGSSSGRFNEDGDNNTFIGEEAGYTNVSGDDSTFVGYRAGFTNATGNSLVLIGSGADVGVGVFSASIGIGRAVAINASNQLKFGSSAYPIYEAYIGDYTAAQNGTHIFVDDVNENFVLRADGLSYFENTLGQGYAEFSGSTFSVLLGDISATNNGIQLSLMDSISTAGIGDLTGAGFNTKITLDDTTGGRNIQINATNLVQLNSNRTLINSGQRVKRTAVNNTDYIVPTSDYVVSMENLSASRTVTIPDASTAFQGTVLIIKDADGLAATHNIILDPAGTDTIDNASTFTMNVNNQSVTLVSDGGTNWEVI